MPIDNEAASPVIGEAAVSATGNSQPNFDERERQRINDPELARAMADADDDALSKFGKKSAKGFFTPSSKNEASYRGEVAAKELLIERYNSEADPGLKLKETLFRDPADAVIAFGNSILANQENYGEAPSLNQEAFSAMAEFAAGINKKRVKSADGWLYDVWSDQGKLILTRSKGNNVLEEWKVEPWKQSISDDRVRGYANNPNRRQVNRGFYHRSFMRQETTEEGFDTVTNNLEKVRDGITAQELEAFRNFLNGIELVQD